MKYDKRITGQIIGRIRTQRGLSQEALSGLAGLDRSHLSVIESGKKSASVETLWRIAEGLEIKPHVLVELIEKELRKDFSFLENMNE